MTEEVSNFAMHVRQALDHRNLLNGQAHDLDIRHLDVTVPQ
jgi:hypothetical protein